MSYNINMYYYVYDWYEINMFVYDCYGNNPDDFEFDMQLKQKLVN